MKFNKKNITASIYHSINEFPHYGGHRFIFMDAVLLHSYSLDFSPYLTVYGFVFIELTSNVCTVVIDVNLAIHFTLFLQVSVNPPWF